MVNFLSLLAGLPQNIQKRQYASSWTTVALETFSDDPDHVQTSVTISGVAYLETYTSNSITYTTRSSETSPITFSSITLPLTTTFTPASACFSEYSAVNNEQFYLTGYSNSYFQLPGNDRTECFPDRNFYVTYYSPGICPFGYSVDSTKVFTSQQSITDTIAFCCPTGYQYQDQASYGGCYNYINSSPTFKTEVHTTSKLTLGPYTISVHYTSLTYISSTMTVSTFTVITGTGTPTLQANGIEVHWQSTDSQVVSWFAQQNFDNKTSGSPPTHAPKRHGISGGAIAGIVVGALAALVLAGIGILFLCKRARKNQGRGSLEYDITPAPQTDYTKVYEHNDTSGKAYHEKTRAELDSNNVSPRVTSPTWTTGSQTPVVSELPGEANARHTSMMSKLSDQSTARNGDVGSIAVPTAQHDSSADRLGLYNNRADSSSIGSEARAQNAAGRGNAQSVRDQQTRLRQEKARLERLQELSEMDALLEAQLKDELDRERS